MKYIVHRRFTNNAICGQIDLPEGSVCESEGNFITYEGKPLCVITSENSHQYFAVNGDGQGLLRGKLTQAIQNCLKVRDENYQTRWDKIWNDEKCQQYKRIEHQDFWLWNHAFFNASIENLKYIANLLEIKEINV